MRCPIAAFLCVSLRHSALFSSAVLKFLALTFVGICVRRFTFKVIGERQGDFVNDIVDSVALALETEKKFLKTSFRDRGKYRSITIDVPVNTSEQIYTVYEAIDRDPRGVLYRAFNASLFRGPCVDPR